MKIRKLPSREHLQNCLDYDQISGVLTWKYSIPGSYFSSKTQHKRFLSRYSGKRAGSLSNQNRYVVGIPGSGHKGCLNANRVIWKLMTGEDPKDGCHIDHKNGDTTDDSWQNLREVSTSINNKNRAVMKSNNSGTRGVCWNSRSGKWKAYIQIDGKNSHLGCFSNKNDAICARETAEKLQNREAGQVIYRNSQASP